MQHHRAGLANPEPCTRLLEASRESLSIPGAAAEMGVEIGGVSIDGVFGVERGEGIKVQVRSCCFRKVTQSASGVDVVEILQHVHTNHQVKGFWW